MIWRVILAYSLYKYGSRRCFLERQNGQISELSSRVGTIENWKEGKHER